MDTFMELVQQVETWASEKGIYEFSSPRAQLLKAFSEMGELADADIKCDKDSMADAVGDTLVCLINYCYMHGIKVDACLAVAYETIKHRKGRMVPNGAFVKEE